MREPWAGWRERRPQGTAPCARPRPSLPTLSPMPSPSPAWGSQLREQPLPLLPHSAPDGVSCNLHIGAAPIASSDLPHRGCATDWGESAIPPGAPGAYTDVSTSFSFTWQSLIGADLAQGRAQPHADDFREDCARPSQQAAEVRGSWGRSSMGAQPVGWRVGSIRREDNLRGLEYSLNPTDAPPLDDDLVCCVGYAVSFQWSSPAEWQSGACRLSRLRPRFPVWGQQSLGRTHTSWGLSL